MFWISSKCCTIANYFECYKVAGFFAKVCYDIEIAKLNKLPKGPYVKINSRRSSYK